MYFIHQICTNLKYSLTISYRNIFAKLLFTTTVLVTKIYFISFCCTLTLKLYTIFLDWWNACFAFFIGFNWNGLRVT